jgi:hypothetical protein
MEATTPLSISMDTEELALLKGLLDCEQDRLLIEIRHTDHRSYREQLRRRLETVERLKEHCRQV